MVRLPPLLPSPRGLGRATLGRLIDAPSGPSSHCARAGRRGGGGGGLIFSPSPRRRRATVPATPELSSPTPPPSRPIHYFAAVLLLFQDAGRKAGTPSPPLRPPPLTIIIPVHLHAGLQKKSLGVSGFLPSLLEHSQSGSSSSQRKSRHGPKRSQCGREIPLYLPSPHTIPCPLSTGPGAGP